MVGLGAVVVSPFVHPGADASCAVPIDGAAFDLAAGNVDDLRDLSVATLLVSETAGV